MMILEENREEMEFVREDLLIKYIDIHNMSVLYVMSRKLKEACKKMADRNETVRQMSI
jgi:hypothetical protein